MNFTENINTLFFLAAFITIAFPTFGVVTTYRFRHRLKDGPKLYKVALYCATWTLVVGVLGTTFGWGGGFIRYVAETHGILDVQYKNSTILSKEIERPRSSSPRYWITFETLPEERIQVTKSYFDSASIERVERIAHTTRLPVFWVVSDNFSLKKFTSFLLCYSLIIFLSCGFFAFAWIPEGVAKPD